MLRSNGAFSLAECPKLVVWANSPFDVLEVQLGTFRHDSCPQFSGDFYRYAPHSDHLFADHSRHGSAGWLDPAGGQAYA